MASSEEDYEYGAGKETEAGAAAREAGGGIPGGGTQRMNKSLARRASTRAIKEVRCLFD